MVESSTTSTGTHYGWRPGRSPDRNSAPLVLLHGVGLDRSMWEPLARHLGDAHPLLTYDLLGHGGSANPPGDRCLDDFGDQLVQLLDHLSLGPVHVAGFSLGGLIAINFAGRYRERTCSLAILNSVFDRPQAIKAAVDARWQQVAKDGPLANVDEAIERWFTPRYREENADRMQWIRDTFSRHTDDGYLKAYGTFVYTRDEELRAAIARIRCPTLVVTSEADVGSTPEMAKAMARAIPGARCHIVKDGQKHMAPVEVADQYAQILDDWIEA